MRNFLNKILKFVSKLILKKYNPKVVAISGSVGKTSTKEMVFSVLSSKFKTRRNEKNYNTEIGVALSIIGIQNSPDKNIFGWMKVFLKALFLLCFYNKKYPEILVLELGADKPGDIQYFMEFIKPFVSIVTAIGEIPVHVEFFSGPLAIAREKSKIISSLPKNGMAILNYDDETVLEMREKTKADILTFGFQEGADVRATDYELLIGEKNEQPVPEGVIFRLNYKKGFIPIHLNSVFGKQQVYAALAAAACGVTFGINQVEISQALLNYNPPPGRMRLLEGIKKSWIIDDSYNASPTAVLAALKTVGEIPSKRKIAVLGDMGELGKYSEEAHRSIGENAAKIVDVIITVGDKARFVAIDAAEEGFPQKNIFSFDTSPEAGKKLRDFIKEGDLVLIKGSRFMEMEKVVEEVVVI